MAGVTVGKGAVIGAGAVVTKMSRHMPLWEVSRAKEIKMRKLKWFEVSG